MRDSKEQEDLRLALALYRRAEELSTRAAKLAWWHRRRRSLRAQAKTLRDEALRLATKNIEADERPEGPQR